MATSDWYKKFPPRGSVSKLATRLVCAVNDNAISKMEGADLLTAPALVDAELQEVREVLGQFEEEWMKPHDYEHEIGIVPNGIPCDECDLSKRARTLMERLKIQ